MKAPINKIIPFSNVDGPGNRCAIFFQSCPFACLYCHNPETIHLCNHCGACVAFCEAKALRMENGVVIWEKDRCVNCDTCIHVCERLASPKVCYMSVDALVQEVKKVSAFIRGVTVSGGECMNHAPFLCELFQILKNQLGLHLLIDSNGDCDFAKEQRLLTLCDGVMLDVKAVDQPFHKQLCGKENDRVLRNLDCLLKQGKLAEVRTVLLPGCDGYNRATIAYVAKHIGNRCRYKLIAYRPYGVREAGLQVFGRQALNQQELKEYERFAFQHGCTQVTLV